MELHTFECLRFASERLDWLMNSEGDVLNGDNTIKSLLKIEHTHFKQILNAIYPRWKEYIGNDWLRKLDPVFLPKDEDDQKLCYGWLLKGFLHENNIFASLTPSLDPNRHQIAIEEIQAKDPLAAQLAFKLKIAENRLESYTHHFPGVFFSQRIDGSFSTIGPAFQEWIDAPLHALHKSPTAFLQLIALEDRGYFLAELKRYTIKQETFSFSYRLKLKSGKILHLLDVRTPQFAPNGLLLGYEGVWLDCTRQVIAEEHLRKSAWKESLGILTGGLLHDFSNLMFGIYSMSELYGSQLEMEHPWKTGMSQIQTAAHEAQALVKRILDLHREGQHQADYFDLKLLIESQLDLLRIILPRQTVLQLDFEKKDFPVYLDGILFRQMLLNLAINTRDALMGQPGTVKIAIRSIEKGGSLGNGFNPKAIAPREGAIVSFEDDAGGIAEDLIPKIFDPFFTTKGSKKGSGLGLYNVKIFIENSHGELGISTQEGHGTTFFVYLPITDFSECDQQISFQEALENNS